MRKKKKKNRKRYVVAMQLTCQNSRDPMKQVVRKKVGWTKARAVGVSQYHDAYGVTKVKKDAMTNIPMR